MTSRSRGASRPRFASSFALFEIRGRREDRVLAAPAVSHANAHGKRRHTSIQGSGNTPAFPAQWLYGLLRALPGERLFCHRRHAEIIPRNLTPAPRRPDHTTSPYASRTLACARFASIASHRTFVTIASAPHLR